ncbi:cation-efflux pump, partial [Burkholderia sp. Cy-647]|nr:cation-efflux pump [Burkholderia sp. Cy-647]
GGLEVDITLAAPGSAPGQAVDAAALRERLGVKRVGIEWAPPGEAAELGGATGMERPPAA